MSREVKTIDNNHVRATRKREDKSHLVIRKKGRRNQLLFSFRLMEKKKSQLQENIYYPRVSSWKL